MLLFMGSREIEILRMKCIKIAFEQKTIEIKFFLSTYCSARIHSYLLPNVIAIDNVWWHDAKGNVHENIRLCDYTRNPLSVELIENE